MTLLHGADEPARQPRDATEGIRQTLSITEKAAAAAPLAVSVAMGLLSIGGGEVRDGVLETLSRRI